MLGMDPLLQIPRFPVVKVAEDENYDVREISLPAIIASG
jgi:hypothetical protein